MLKAVQEEGKILQILREFRRAKPAETYYYYYYLIKTFLTAVFSSDVITPK